jgi:methylmalonyl-CoA/ethylmalonyl-CoA epimerase
MRQIARAMTFALFILTAGSNLSAPLAVAQDSIVGFDITPHHFGISVPNLEESIAWYQKMLGFKVVSRMGQGSGMLVALMQRGNFHVELFQAAGAKPMPEYRRDPSSDLRVNGLCQIAFQVADVQAAVKELKAKGVEVSMGPVDSAGVVFAFIHDNSGINIELIQYKKQ